MDKHHHVVHLKCSVHYPEINDEGLETPKTVVGSGVDLLPTSPCSNLAADVLSDMFQKQEIEGKVIMKADNAKGMHYKFARSCFVSVLFEFVENTSKRISMTI